MIEYLYYRFRKFLIESSKYIQIFRELLFGGK